MACEMTKTRISQDEVGASGYGVVQGFFPQEHRSVAWLTHQGQVSVRDGAGTQLRKGRCLAFKDFSARPTRSLYPPISSYDHQFMSMLWKS